MPWALISDTKEKEDFKREMRNTRIFTVLTLLMAFAAKGFAADEMYYTGIDFEAAKKAAVQSASVAEGEASMTSSSRIDWTKQAFTSSVSIDVIKANIPMPSGKSSALNRIKINLPLLVKAPLLSIYLDDSRTIGDLILEGTLTLDELTRVIDGAQQTPASFKNGSDTLETQHSIRLQDIGSLLVKHNNTYTQQKPIERIASRPYTGIVIDARGSLPVHGEFVESEVEPCLFPRIWDENMTLVYERNMVTPDIAKRENIVSYLADRTSANYEKRVGSDPLWITAKQVYGAYRCDPVISHDDYLRIATVPQNLELLKQGKVVILLGKDKLAHTVEAAEKGVRYWKTFTNIKYVFEDAVPGTVVKDTDGGVQITVQNMRFIADSAELLPDEKDRISLIAEQIKSAVADGEYTILVEGHTADVNKPEGQLALSIQRAKAIIKVLTEQGIDNSLFTYKGFGGTKPVADNSTAEGRAANRRVEIIIMPKKTSTQRM